jgi:hypothetical protein
MTVCLSTRRQRPAATPPARHGRPRSQCGVFELDRHRFRRVVGFAQTAVHVCSELGFRPVCLSRIYDPIKMRKPSRRMRRLLASDLLPTRAGQPVIRRWCMSRGELVRAGCRFGAAGQVDRGLPGRVGRAPGRRVGGRRGRRRLAGRPGRPGHGARRDGHPGGDRGPGSVPAGRSSAATARRCASNHVELVVSGVTGLSLTGQTAGEVRTAALKAPVGLNPHSSVSRTGSRCRQDRSARPHADPFGVLREPHIAPGGKPGLGQRAGIPDKQVVRRRDLVHAPGAIRAEHLDPGSGSSS